MSKPGWSGSVKVREKHAEQPCQVGTMVTPFTESLSNLSKVKPLLNGGAKIQNQKL